MKRYCQWSQGKGSDDSEPLLFFPRLAWNHVGEAGPNAGSGEQLVFRCYDSLWIVTADQQDTVEERAQIVKSELGWKESTGFESVPGFPPRDIQLK